MEALEHLVYEDPEPLLKRLLPRDRVDARVLVAQRADPVDLDVRRRQHHALAAHRNEGLERLLHSLLDQLAPAGLLAPRRDQALVDVGRKEALALLGARALYQQPVQVGDRLLEVLSARPLHQGGDLQQLEVARRRPHSVEMGVEAHLAHPRADPREISQNLVAQLAKDGRQVLAGAQQLLSSRLLVRVERRSGLFVER